MTENITMEFGKVKDISKVDFSLSKEPEQNSRIFNKKGSAKIYVGAPGWRRPDWVGKIYPKGTKPKDFLKVYSQVFNSIELNSTHYRVPTKDLVKYWKSQVHKEFKFSPKIPQAISHYGGLGNNSLIKEFANAISLFEENLGLTFLQLSENFESKRLGELRAFISLWPKELPLSIEVRHESWFKDNSEFFDLLEKENISSIISDVAGRRDVLHMRLTNHKVMIRYVSYNSNTDKKRLALWSDKIKEWSDKGMKEIYFFIHDPAETVAPETADVIIENLQNLGVEGLKRIEFIKDPKAEQLGLI